MTLIKQILTAFISVAIFIFDANTLSVDWFFALVMVGGSFSGAWVLGYFKRSPHFWQRVIKIFASAIASLFIAPAFAKYFRVESIEYLSLVAFLHGFLILLLLRGLLSVTEENGKTFIVRIIRTFLPLGGSDAGLQLRDPRPVSRRRGRVVETETVIVEQQTNKKEGE